MTVLERFNEKWEPEPMSGCWLWTGCCQSDGYGHLRNQSGKMQQAHRISWELNVGEIPDGLCVLHRCDTRTCVNPKHLFLGTQADNVRDMLTKGRLVSSFGESNGWSKLTEQDVRKIRALEGQVTAIEIGKIFGVSGRHIGSIHRRQRWAHI